MGISRLFQHKFIDLLKETFKSFFESDLDKYAAALAFQMLFSVIPFLIVFIAILGFLDLEGIFQILHDQAEAVVPGDATELVSQLVQEIELPTGGFIPLALLFALWIASSAMRSATHALNIAYKVEETRPFWSEFLYSILYTLAIVLLLIGVLLLMIVGPQALEWITGLVALDDIFITIWTWLRWPVAMILLIITIALIYFVAPNVKQRFWKIIPGSVLSVVVWIGLSIGFDFYMRTFVDLSILFGGLGAIIFLMIYFYISAAVLLFGAELNAVIARRVTNEKKDEKFADFVEES